MSRLRLKMRRDLWLLRWRALAIILTIASGIVIYVGTSMGLTSLFHTRDSIFEELHFADLEARIIPDDVNNLPDFTSVPGVERVERRLVFPGAIRSERRPPLMAVMTFLETPDPGIHSFQFIAGRSFRPDELDAVVIERALAVEHGYRVGDSLAVQVGGRTYQSHIVGVAITPEYFVSSANPDYFIPERGSLGIVYGNLGRTSDSLGFTMVNDFLFRFAPGANRASVKAAVQERLRDVNVEQLIPRERHFSQQYIETELQALRFFLPAMVLILLALASVITFLNFNRLVAVQRREIGTLLALGYGRGRLVMSYLEAGVILGALGGVLGEGVGFFMRDVFARACGGAMGMPIVRTSVDAVILARGFLFGLLVVAVSAVVPVIRLMRLPTREIIRSPIRSAEIRGLSRAWPGGSLMRLPAGYRHALRDLARQRGRTLTTLTSIALALGVAVAYRMSAGSIDETLTRRFNAEPWHLVTDFLYPVFPEDVAELARLPGVLRTQPYLRRHVGIEAHRRYEDATLIGVDFDSDLSRLHLTEGRAPRSAGVEEVVLNLELAERLGVGIGDVVRVLSESRQRELRLVGLLSDAIADAAVVPLPVAQEICELPEKLSGMFIEANGGTDGLVDALYAREVVGRVTRKVQLVAGVGKLLSVMYIVLDLAAAVSIFVAALFILSHINLAVLENEGEFATLKALGYGRAALARIILVESFACSIGGAIASVPIAAIISAYLNHRMSLAWFRVDNFFFPFEEVKVLVPYMALIPVGSYPALRHILDLDVSKAIRARAAE